MSIYRTVIIKFTLDGITQILAGICIVGAQYFQFCMFKDTEALLFKASPMLHIPLLCAQCAPCRTAPVEEAFCECLPWASRHKTTLIPGDVCMVDIRLETRQKTPTHAHGAHPGRFLLAAATLFGRRSHSLGRSVGRRWRR